MAGNVASNVAQIFEHISELTRDDIVMGVLPLFHICAPRETQRSRTPTAQAEVRVAAFPARRLMSGCCVGACLVLICGPVVVLTCGACGMACPNERGCQSCERSGYKKRVDDERGYIPWTQEMDHVAAATSSSIPAV